MFVFCRTVVSVSLQPQRSFWLLEIFQIYYGTIYYRCIPWTASPAGAQKHKWDLVFSVFHFTCWDQKKFILLNNSFECRYTGLSATEAGKKGDSCSGAVVSPAGSKCAEFQPLSICHHQPKVLPELCSWLQCFTQPIHSKQCWGGLLSLSCLWKGMIFTPLIYLLKGNIRINKNNLIAYLTWLSTAGVELQSLPWFISLPQQHWSSRGLQPKG